MIKFTKLLDPKSLYSPHLLYQNMKKEDCGTSLILFEKKLEGNQIMILSYYLMLNLSNMNEN